jgi:threonine aldolase
MDRFIDLRSDTVTKPTTEMRSAMAAAEVGDDVYFEDPTVNLLQKRAAEIFAKEAALFVPSGTMGNQIAVRLHTCPGQEVILEQRSHIFNYEMAALAAINGCLPRPVSAPNGILSWEMIRGAIAPKIYYRAQTGLVAIENTHNMAGGTVYTAEQIDDICGHCHEAGLPVHLDGARIFNAAIALHTTVARLTRSCDSVMFCLSKGLAAPVGSMLVGPAAWIERARAVRKLLGGGMRQVGILAAAGLIALEKMPFRLVEDHDNAKLLAQQLCGLSGLEVRPQEVQTNIVVVGIAQTGCNSAEFQALLKNQGVLCGTIDPSTLRLLTHLDVNRNDMFQAAEIFKGVLAELQHKQKFREVDSP